MTALIEAPEVAVTPITPEHVRRAAAHAQCELERYAEQWSPERYDNHLRGRSYDAKLVAACDVVWTARQSEVDALTRRIAGLERQLAYARERLGRYCDTAERAGVW